MVDIFTNRLQAASRLESSTSQEHNLEGSTGPEFVRRKVWRLPQAGRVSHMAIVEESLPHPRQGEVLVAVKAVGLNFADIFAILGLYGATPKGSFIPGLEFSGQVQAVGEGVSNFKEGDKVLGFTRFGAYSSHINSPEHFLRPLPEKWSYEEGASFIVQGLTAWHGLVSLGALKKGQTVLVQSAAGGVGLIALDICRQFGAVPFAVVGSARKVDFLMSRCALSRERIVVRTPKTFKTDLTNALKTSKVPQDGFDIVMESAGGSYFTDTLQMLSRGGRLITFGSGTYMSTTDGPNWLSIIPKYFSRPKVDPGDLIQENRSVMGFNLIWLTDKVAELNEELDEMMKMETRAPFVGKVFKFDEAKQAIQYFQSGNSIGKVVLVL